MRLFAVFARVLAFLIIPALIFTGCDLLGHDDGDEEEHLHMETVEIETRGAQPEVVATWTEDDGWDVDELPALQEPADDDDPEDQRVAWTIRVLDDHGDEVHLSEGGEHEGAYGIAAGSDSDALYFDPELGVAPLPDGDADVFHGDHVHIYPRSAGEVEIFFGLWHDGHFDDQTDPVTLRVESQEE